MWFIVVDQTFQGNIVGNQFHGRGNISKETRISCIRIAPGASKVVVEGNSVVVSDKNIALFEIDTESPFYRANSQLNLDDNNVVGNSKLYYQKESKIKKIPQSNGASNALELTTLFKEHYPQIKNGLITYRENSNVIIITFNNVYISEPISSGVLTLAGTGVYLKYQTDTMPSQTNKEDGKAGMMFMSALGSIGIRVPSLGTYASQIVVFMDNN